MTVRQYHRNPWELLRLWAGRAYRTVRYGYGGLRLWRDAGWPLRQQAAAGLVAFVVAPAWGWWASGLAGAATYAAARWAGLEGRGARGGEWWSRIEEAMYAANVVPRPKEGDRRPSWRGTRTKHDDGTVSVKVKLPPPATFERAQSKRAELASGLDVPLARFAILHDEADPPSVITLRVGTGEKVKPRLLAVHPDVVSDWRAPVAIGLNAHGEEVELDTVGANTLIGGIPGSGKTTLAKRVLSHYLLDSSTAVYLVDGNGSEEDYGDCRDLCTRFVFGTDPNAVDDAQAVLDEVLALVGTRAGSRGVRHPGVLLHLEEWQNIRSAAGQAARKRLDETLGRIVRMGRKAAVHIVISTQRPTTDDLPSGSRNLFSQGVALVVRNAQDAALILGDAPSLPLPRKGKKGDPRHGIVRQDGGGADQHVAVVLDHLDGAGWAAVCARAAVLRRVGAPVPVPDLGAPTVAPEPAQGPLANRRHAADFPDPEPVEGTDPLAATLTALFAAFDAAHGRPLTTSELAAALPEHLSQTPDTLGRWLAGRWADWFERAPGRGRRWQRRRVAA